MGGGKGREAQWMRIARGARYRPLVLRTAATDLLAARKGGEVDGHKCSVALACVDWQRVLHTRTRGHSHFSAAPPPHLFPPITAPGLLRPHTEVRRGRQPKRGPREEAQRAAEGGGVRAMRLCPSRASHPARTWGGGGGGGLGGVATGSGGGASRFFGFVKKGRGSKGEIKRRRKRSTAAAQRHSGADGRGWRGGGWRSGGRATWTSVTPLPPCLSNASATTRCPPLHAPLPPPLSPRPLYAAA